MFSVQYSADLVQIQVRETICVVFLARMDIAIQVWHMVEVMSRGFNEHLITQVLMTENQHVGMKYTEFPDLRYLAKPFDDFLLPCEEIYVENLITIEEDEGFSQPNSPVCYSPRQPPVMEARHGLCSIENLQLLDSSLI